MKIPKKLHAFTLGLLVVIGISAAAHWQWLVLPGILTASDWWYIPNDVFKEYLTAPKILEGAVDFNPGRLTPTFDLLRVIGGVIAFYFHAFPIWERLFFLWPIALLGPVPIYIILYRRFSSALGAISGSVVYICNSYILAREISHVHIAIAYLLFAPLLFLTLDNLLSRPSIKTGALFTLAAIIFSVYEIRILYIIAIMLIAYVLYTFITKISAPSYKLFSVAQLSVIVIILAQSFWLIPFIFSHESLGYATFTERGLFQSFGTIQHSITLSDPAWTGKGYIPFTTQPIQLFLYAIPIFALLWAGIKPKGEKTKDLWFWLVVACIGAFLAKGQNAPLPDIYPWLFNHIPGFRLFRESAKFSVVADFAYAILIAASVTFLEKRKKGLAIISTLLLTGYAGIMIAPFISGRIHDLSTSYTVPDEYASFQKILTEDKNFSRSLWIPQPERFVYYSETHPKVDAGTVLSNEWKPFIVNQNDPYSLFTQPNAKALLDFGSIRYIGVPSDTTKDIYQWFGRSKKGFASLLASIPQLHSIPSSDSEIPLWENKDAKDRIYITNDVTLVDNSALEFSNLDTNKAGAFIFRPDIPDYLFSLLTQKLATNQEAKPFTIENINVENNTITTKLQLLPNSKLKTTTRDIDGDIISELYAQRTDETISLYYKIGDESRTIGTFSSASDTFIVHINGKVFPAFKPTNNEQSIGIARIKRTENRAKIYSQIEMGDTLIQDPSFEKGVPGDVGDCANEDGSTLESNGIEANLVPDATDGAQALALSAKKHLGCIFFGIHPSKNATLYSLTIDHKSKSGDAGSIKILDETAPGAQLAAQQLEKDTNWHTTEITFQAPSTFKNKITAYIYQPGSDHGGNPATTLFDNMHINAYQLLGETLFTNEEPSQKDPVVRDFQTTDVTITPQYPYEAKDVVEDGIFEQGKEYVAGDCNNINQSLPAKNGIAAHSIEDDNGHALSIKAAHQLACVGMDLSLLDPAFDYLISMRYKNTQGNPPSIALYSPNGTSIAPITLPEQNDSAWHEFRTIIHANEVAPDSTLMLYVSADTTPSEAAFDDIHMMPIPVLPDISITSANKPLKLITTEAQTINPLVHIIKSETIDRHRLLVLSSRYDEGWKLFVRPQGAPPLSWWRRILRTPPGVEISVETHIKANAFVNAWVLDPKEIQEAIGTNTLPEFTIKYAPQRFMDTGTIISVATILIYFSGVVVLILKEKLPKDKQYQSTNSYTDTEE